MLTFAPFSKACVQHQRGLTRKVFHPMAAVCEICGKKPSFGMNVSHSHRRTKRRWDPNIQRVRALVDGAPKRLHVCTSCLRAGKVTKPLRRTHAPIAD
jgi:large subunit ribosomal protein L28